MTTRCFTTFAYDEPLHASSLNAILRCPLSVTLLHLGVIEKPDGGIAAQTGSMVHEGIADWHKHNDYEKALNLMKSLADKYPRADHDEARRFLRPYTEDSRNQGKACETTELKIEFEIDPSPNDPTGLPIKVVGTLDQVRYNGREYELWDIKTGKSDGVSMLHEHALQLCAYSIGYNRLTSRKVKPGGIIRMMGYRRRDVESANPSGVFYYAPYTYDDGVLMINYLVEVIAMIRKGLAWPNPGFHCSNICPFKEITNCLYELKRLT